MDISTYIETALAQAPILTIVLVFLYFNNRDWRKHLAERNAKMEKSLNAMTDEITKSNERLFTHLDRHS